MVRKSAFLSRWTGVSGPGMGGASVLVERHGDLVLICSSLDELLHPDEIGDLARELRSADRAVTLIAGARAIAADGFWPCLSELLDSLCAAGTTVVRLVLADSGTDQPDEPALAQRIADAWGLSVEAPNGTAFVVPGGSLFAPLADGRDGGWRRFSPAAEPLDLGPRCPAPPWQSDLWQVPLRTAGGCLVEQIPSGLLVRPAAASVPRDLYHAVPVDRCHLTVVVGLPAGEHVADSDLADLLAKLPGPVRSGVRLAPGGPRDLLPTARRIADQLGAELEVSTGLPLLVAAERSGSDTLRSALIRSDGTPGWLPFVSSVVCRPTRRGDQAPPPTRLLRWNHPLSRRGTANEAVISLIDGWHTEVTRVGLWVSRPGAVRGPDLVPPVSEEGPVIEVGAPGEQLDFSVARALGRLLDVLPADLRGNTTLYVHGDTPHRGRELAGLVARYGLRGLRYTGDERLLPALAERRNARLPAQPVAPEPPLPSSGPVPVEIHGPRHAVVGANIGDPEEAWGHLIRGRVGTLTANHHELRPVPAERPQPSTGPDLDAAWEHLSRARVTATDG